MPADIARLDLANIALELQQDGVLVATLNRPAKRNALDAATVEEMVRLFDTAPRAGVRAIVLAAAGDHLCAGLDLVEHPRDDRSPADFMHICLRWHEAFNKMEYGGVPVIAALKGAVVGGGAGGLAREAGLLAGAGYDLVEATVVDAFPQTPHVEVVTRFDRHAGRG